MPLLVPVGVFFLLVMLAAGIAAFAPKSALEPFRRLADFAARRPLAAIIAAAFLILGPVRDAVTKGTNEPPRGASNDRVEHVERVDSFGPPARSAWLNAPVPFFLLESEATNETYLYAMPTNGMRRESWWLRGAYEDVFRLDLDRLLFPLGTNLCDSLWVYTWGMVGAHLGDASNRIVATGAPIGMMLLSVQITMSFSVHGQVGIWISS